MLALECPSIWPNRTGEALLAHTSTRDGLFKAEAVKEPNIVRLTAPEPSKDDEPLCFVPSATNSKRHSL
jgi:hypothetical protein